jgi:IS30 family transposase
LPSFIDERPSIVDSQERFGDWEIDTVLGKHGTGAIVTILERKSSFYLARKVSSKSADAVTRATIEMLLPLKDCVHTITADNGREFAGHEQIGAALELTYILPTHIVLGSEEQTKTRMVC